MTLFGIKSPLLYTTVKSHDFGTTTDTADVLAASRKK